jgi:lysophospholipase L1-like esterase
MNEPNTLLLFGDSNTHCTMPMRELGERNRHPLNVRWTSLIASKLGDDWRVIDEGLPGRTTVHDDPIEGAHKNGATVLPAILETHRSISVIAIMLGTNDLKYRFGVNAFDIAQSIGKLIRIIRASDCGPEGEPPKIIVIAPPPIQEVGALAKMFKEGGKLSLDLGKEIKIVAKRENVLFADLNNHVCVSNIDGVHYEPEAMEPIATLMFECVRKLGY